MRRDKLCVFMVEAHVGPVGGLTSRLAWSYKLATMKPGTHTIGALLRGGATDRAALLAPGRATLTHGALQSWLDECPEQLATLGVSRGHTVALVLEPGPALATAFLVLASAGVAVAPLNPDYQRAELEFYFADLQPGAVVLSAGATGPATQAAAANGLPILELVEGEQAGRFSLRGAAGKARATPARPEDVALLLHTSGTTARPKLVPLTHANLTASAGNIMATLALTASDCCLNVMPLFHIHGLVAGLLAPLGAGGAVYCPPGFNALKFAAWLTDSQATWYTAVPTMHQAVLARRQRQQRAPGDVSLRLIRSSSASLPPAVMRELEASFGVPVIESYGMTEASHQMTSNPLPPAARKPGSVGLAAGPEIRVRRDGGWAGVGQEGEIVIRGANVISAYRAADEVNAAAFVDGWFRTGDQGYFDADGYLFITGRLKELINRGGEKISPREVDDALLEHPDVALVVTFAMPHPKLGEEVAAAVVLKPGARLDESELRAFARGRLAAFKVPRRVVFVAEIPKGPTGKLRRIGLAQALGLG
jgi:acyl-CoA synthetase (AMP-forming)/AMP-acid ligase II